jgi:hypothetical protein
MSKSQWEYDLVERPFCEQLKLMGWQWTGGDKDVPDFTERANFSGVSLTVRVARVSSRMLADDVRRRILARKTLPPSRRASVSASLRRDRAEARGEGGKAPLRRDGGPPRYLDGYGSCDDSWTHPG